MKAVRVHAYGGPEVMKLEDIPLPSPGAGEVLVRFHAAGVNYIDTYFRSGAYKAPSLPFVLGNEGAGGRRIRGFRRAGLEGGRPCRLRRHARLLRGRALGAGRPARQTAGRDFLRDRGGDDAEGPYGAIPFASNLCCEAWRYDPRACRRRRCRPSPLPVGQASRRDSHRNGGNAGESRIGQEGRCRSRHSVPDRGVRGAGKGPHRGASSALWFTTVSARIRFRDLWTVCAHSACSPASARPPARSNRSTSISSHQRGRCS